MIVIESKRILKESAPLALILIALLIAIVTGDKDIYLTPILEIFLLLQASYLGWSLFERERQDGAMEYLLSLPLSRTRLFLLKFLSRFIWAAVLLGFYLLSHSILRLPSYLPPLQFSMCFGAFFLVSLSLAISFRNFFSAFILTSLLTFGQVILILQLDITRTEHQAILQANLTVLAFPLLFFFMFQTFDIRPTSHFNKKFLPGLLALILLITGFIYFTSSPSWNNYFLTSKGAILRNTCRVSELLLAGSSHPYDSCLVALRETTEGNGLFVLSRRKEPGKPCRPLSIDRLNLTDGKKTTLYAFSGGWQIIESIPGEAGGLINEAFNLLLENQENRELRILTITGNDFREKPLATKLSSPDSRQLLSVLAEPLQFFILTGKRLQRILEKGQAEDLGPAEQVKFWKNRMAIFNLEGIGLFEIGETITPIFQKMGDFKLVGKHGSSSQAPQVLFRSKRDYFLLDMEKGSETAIKLNQIPFDHLNLSGILTLIYFDEKGIKIIPLGENRLSPETWNLGIEVYGLRTSPFGILVFNPAQYEVHPFKK